MTSIPYTSGAINAIRTFQDMCRYIKADLAGIVYGTASDPGEIQSQAKVLTAHQRYCDGVAGIPLTGCR